MEEQDKPDRTEKTEEKTWKDRVEEIVASQAMALNYEHGVTCRVLPTESEDGSHTLRLSLDLTHSGHDFDLEWEVAFEDKPAALRTRLTGPEGAVGTLWEESFVAEADFARAAKGLPYFVQGFFAGRAAHSEV